MIFISFSNVSVESAISSLIRSCAALGHLFGGFGAVMGRFWAALGHSWAALRRSWDDLGWLLVALEPLLGGLGAVSGGPCSKLLNFA